MDIQENKFYDALKKLIGGHFHKILSIDLTADTYEALSVGDFEWAKKTAEMPTEKISDWFRWFADGPLCYDADRERFKKFTDLEALKTAFEKNGAESLSIVYRRKFDLSDKIYSTVSMELYPSVDDEGHITAFLFVKNISDEILKYNSSLEDSCSVKTCSAGKRTLLVVEDNEMNREILSDILSDDYNVLQAENGAEGLEVLQQHMMDTSLVVLDVQMPVMNGYEFLKYVKKDAFLSEIPVIVATGSNNSEEERLCLSLGASDFVEKPYNFDIIKSRIANIIRLRESAATMSMLQTDELTGLYTMQGFYYHAGKLIENNPDQSYSVMIFDIDHCKQLYENYGEKTGNGVLQTIADVLREKSAPSDICGRFENDTFAVIRESMSPEETDSVVRGIFAAIKEKCEIKNISIKSGIYNDVDRTLSIQKICDRAMTAMNEISRNFKSRYAIYDSAHEAKELRLSIMEAGMRDAYNNDEFAVYYQPKHDTYTGKLLGAEALIRWIHPQYGFMSPGEFIPLFEKNGFITYADYYVLERTCRNLRKWMDEGIPVVPVSVNGSRKDFEQPDFINTIKRPLTENGIDPSLIHIEVTETLFSENMDALSQLLQQCRDEGFKIELDDFGSGYSSLTTLAALPLDVIKLDMSFMKNYKDEKKQKILSSCISLTKNLGLKTVSEGVETKDQLVLLQRYGCDLIQGYYFSKPIPEDAFREYLINHKD